MILFDGKTFVNRLVFSDIEAADGQLLSAEWPIIKTQPERKKYNTNFPASMLNTSHTQREKFNQCKLFPAMTIAGKNSQNQGQSLHLAQAQANPNYSTTQKASLSGPPAH